MCLKPLPLFRFDEGRLLVSTSEAAFLLKLRDQTLRKWAMDGSGPIQSLKIGNRLMSFSYFLF